MWTGYFFLAFPPLLGFVFLATIAIYRIITSLINKGASITHVIWLLPIKKYILLDIIILLIRGRIENHKLFDMVLERELQ